MLFHLTKYMNNFLSMVHSQSVGHVNGHCAQFTYEQVRGGGLGEFVMNKSTESDTYNQPLSIPNF